MPITITPPFPGLYVGPGVAFDAVTDLPPPVPAGSQWHVQPWAISGSFEVGGPIFTYPFSGPRVTAYLYGPGETQGATSKTRADAVFENGDNVHLVVKVLDPLNVELDNGSINAKWSNTVGELQRQLNPPTGGQGLTPAQAQQLDEIHLATHPSVLLDQLTLHELTNGPQGGFVNSFLPDVTFGILVRIANVPPELIFNTPDGDYAFPSLCVVRIYRGSDLWIRAPVHTSSKIITLPTSNLVAAVDVLTATNWVLNLSLQASFREGVTGQVFRMLLP